MKFTAIEVPTHFHKKTGRRVSGFGAPPVPAEDYEIRMTPSMEVVESSGVVRYTNAFYGHIVTTLEEMKMIERHFNEGLPLLDQKTIYRVGEAPEEYPDRPAAKEAIRGREWINYRGEMNGQAKFFLIPPHAPKPESDTPRTDALVKEIYQSEAAVLNYPCEARLTEFARNLERENDVLREQIALYV